MSKKKVKLNKKAIILIASVLTLLLIVLLIFLLKDVNVGKIVNGKAEYIDRIVNVTKYENNTIIEFENDYEYIDNCIVTTEIYNKLKKDDPLYNISVLDYSKLKDISNKEAYNINRALQDKVVKESDKYHEYFSKTCGFKNKKQLIKYIEAVIKLSKKESARMKR